MTVPGRRERKRQQTLDRIANTAFALFEAHGYPAVTMEQIATGADVAKGTLYNHFPVKEAVLAHWIHAELAADLPRLLPDVLPEADFVTGITRVLDASADWCEQHRVYLPPYLRFRFLGIEQTVAAEDSVARSDIADAFGHLIGEGQRSGELRDDLPTAQLSTLFHHLYLGALMRWLGDPELVLREEFAAVVELFVKGAARPIARRSGSTS